MYYSKFMNINILKNIKINEEFKIKFLKFSIPMGMLFYYKNLFNNMNYKNKIYYL